MAEVFDEMIDSTGEEIHKDGDVFVSECTKQNQKLLIITEKGSLKHEPTAGVGVLSWILDELDSNDLKKEIQSEFEEDGMTVSSLEFKSLSDSKIKASYGQ